MSILKTPTRTSVAAATVFLNELSSAYQEQYGMIPHETDASRVYIINGNAIYIGVEMAGIPYAGLAFDSEKYRQMITAISHVVDVPRYAEELPLDLADVKSRLDTEKQCQRIFGSYSRHTARYVVELPDRILIGFDCERLLTDAKMLGGSITIQLPERPIHAAILRGNNGCIYQLPVRLS